MSNVLTSFIFWLVFSKTWRSTRRLKDRRGNWRLSRGKRGRWMWMWVKGECGSIFYLETGFSSVYFKCSRKVTDNSTSYSQAWSPSQLWGVSWDHPNLFVTWGIFKTKQAEVKGNLSHPPWNELRWFWPTTKRMAFHHIQSETCVCCVYVHLCLEEMFFNPNSNRLLSSYWLLFAGFFSLLTKIAFVVLCWIEMPESVPFHLLNHGFDFFQMSSKGGPNSPESKRRKYQSSVPK